MLLNLLFSGGATFTINGEGFSHVGEITVERVVSLSFEGVWYDLKCIVRGGTLFTISLWLLLGHTIIIDVDLVK